MSLEESHSAFAKKTYKAGQLLTRFIKEKIQGNNNWDSVDIVCHSMGGIVTRAACKQGAPVKRAVYIASPHFGNPMAYFALNPEIHTEAFSDFFEQPAIFHKPVSTSDTQGIHKEAIR